MAKTRQQKEQELSRLQDNLSKSKSVVFTTFNKLSVADSRVLRQELRQANVAYQVGKKSLLKQAFAQSQMAEENFKSLTSNVGVAFGLEDEVAPAKVLAKFAKTHEQLKLQGGLLENKYIAKDKVLALANLPSKLELIAQVVRTVKNPLTGLVNVLSGNLRGLVNVLSAIKDNK